MLQAILILNLFYNNDNNHDADVDENYDILNMIASFDDAVHESEGLSTIAKPETVYFNEVLTAITNANRFPALISKKHCSLDIYIAAIRSLRTITVKYRLSP